MNCVNESLKVIETFGLAFENINNCVYALLRIRVGVTVMVNVRFRVTFRVNVRVGVTVRVQAL